MYTNSNNTINNTPCKLPRMRSLPKAYAAIKELDSETAFSMRALRRMVRSGELPSVTVGNRRLINLDLLFEKLEHYDETMCG